MKSALARTRQMEGFPRHGERGMVKIRLARVGAKKRPFYRVVAIDVRRQRDGRPLEFLGTYDPRPQPAKIVIKTERLEAWIAKGAQLTPTVRSLVRRARRQARGTPSSGAAAQ